MADTEHENPLGVTDDRRTQNQTSAPGNLNVDNRYLSVGSLRAALAARSASTYTTSVLNRMTKNDMVYALRLFDDAGGVN